MIVTTLGEPSLFVLVNVSVTNGGALVTVCPALFVVVMNTVDWSVVLYNSSETNSNQSNAVTMILRYEVGGWANGS